jgi:benzoyl-CoA reductase/2-hydroxyglutaryl-CoA dehydratase subunit BcrC/BadD/HgdB
LPRNLCPLVKSSFGSIVNKGCLGIKSCPHFNLVDLVVAENTCDSKKKMYELLVDYIPTYVIDLPQKPDSPEALNYFLAERYIKIPCSCMSPNDRRIEKILEPVREFDIDGVVLLYFVVLPRFQYREV